MARSKCGCATRRFRPLGEPPGARYAQWMTWSDEQVQSFIECWKKDFGEVLTPEQARAEAMRLLDFFAALAQMLRHKRHSAPPAARDIPIT